MWVDPATLSVQLLVYAARDRRPVRYRRGQAELIGTLVRWPSARGRIRRYVRVRNQRGATFTIRTTDVVAVDIETRQERQS